MAKVTIILEDTPQGLEVKNSFEPELASLEEDSEMTSAQIAAFDILHALAEAADEVVVEDAVYKRSDTTKKGMH